jgi:hypothetical protein
MYCGTRRRYEYRDSQSDGKNGFKPKKKKKNLIGTKFPQRGAFSFPLALATSEFACIFNKQSCLQFVRTLQNFVTLAVSGP